MSSPATFRRFCQVIAAVFLLLAAFRVAAAFVPLVDPLMDLPTPGCANCELRTDPVLLLEPEAARRAAWLDPSAQVRLRALVETGSVRMGLTIAQLLQAIPFAILLAGLALAIRSLAARGIAPSTMRGLKISALGGVGYALAHPIAQSLRWTIFSPVTTGADQIHVVVDLGAMLWPLLLSGAVWVTASTMQQALALQDELEDFV